MRFLVERCHKSWYGWVFQGGSQIAGTIGNISGRVVGAGLRLRRTLICQFRGEIWPHPPSAFLPADKKDFCINPKTFQPLYSIFASLWKIGFIMVARLQNVVFSYPILFHLKYYFLWSFKLLWTQRKTSAELSHPFVPKLFCEAIINHGSIKSFLKISLEISWEICQIWRKALKGFPRSKHHWIIVQNRIHFKSNANQCKM